VFRFEPELKIKYNFVNGLSKNSYNLVECWGLVWIKFGLNTKVGLFNVISDFRVIGATEWRSGFVCLWIFLVAFQSEPFVGLRLEM